MAPSIVPSACDYIKAHVEQMKEAVKDGVELIGYTMWGFIDWSPAAAWKCPSGMA